MGREKLRCNVLQSQPQQEKRDLGPAYRRRARYRPWIDEQCRRSDPELSLLESWTNVAWAMTLSRRSIPRLFTVRSPVLGLRARTVICRGTTQSGRREVAF